MPSHYFRCTKMYLKQFPYCLTLGFPSQLPQSTMFSGYSFWKNVLFIHKYLCVCVSSTASGSGNSTMSQRITQSLLLRIYTNAFKVFNTADVSNER